MIEGLIILDCEQGSDEWLEARRGIPTGTGIGSIVNGNGEKSSGWVNYLSELVEEHINGINVKSKTSFMERGTELEPEARSYYEIVNDCEVIQVGGVYLNDKKELMISPDGLIPEKRKGLEIKCPRLSTHVKYLINGVLPNEYKMQVQSALWVTGYDTWDFVSYCPEYKKEPFFLITIERDEKIMKALDEHIPSFLRMLKQFKD
ncbi:YqaJ viral recombinase family protein [Pasteurellaceae bacterium HPA106]|uniref:YqaJ viral recombinase family protein n=1 Tax=Spirabiliibacterium pneumoniae TaxID=221400 RepID=UPI001AADFDAA|nr:YqaJ viral recombinase family protein [Spirabiliibacterium pneumoniae]MBE2895748.1 YqaJ viral recombinase family protein [Spirabiliibacterium pneumoniae]